jgi:hypothetical protein
MDVKEIEKITLGPRDVLHVVLDDDIASNQAGFEIICDKLRQAFPDNKVIVSTAGMTLKVIAAGDAEAAKKDVKFREFL